MKLAVPDMISNSYFPAEAAVALGFCKAEGLDVALELIFPVDKAYAALRDGAVDFVAGSAHSAPCAILRVWRITFPRTSSKPSLPAPWRASPRNYAPGWKRTTS